MPDLISVIVTTYDREDALDAALSALSRQNDRGFEVVIADDGSRPRDRRAGRALAAAARRGARPCLAAKSGLSRRRDPQPGARSLPAATIACSSTAIASRGRTSSQSIASWRNRGWFVTGNRVLLVAGTDRCRAARGVAAGDVEPRPNGSRSAAAAASIGWRRCCACRSGRCASSVAAMARRALVQSRGLALGSRSGRRLRREFQRLGPRRFRSVGPPAASRATPQGRALRDRRHSPLASGQADRAQLSANDARLDDGAA